MSSIDIVKRAIVDFREKAMDMVLAQSNAKLASEKAIFVAYEKAYSEAIEIFYELLHELDDNWNGKMIEKEVQDA
jgi:hypothetical protein